ncbi:hypothetical protein GQ457_17G006780 [Hibiscus cannabinus]
MALVAWNVRGLGKKDIVRALKNVCFKYKNDIVFLSETKQKRSPDIPSRGRRTYQQGRRIHIRIFSYIPKRGTYQQESRIKVKDKDLKPKRIKDYLECKISQRSPALLKYLLFNDS